MSEFIQVATLDQIPPGQVLRVQVGMEWRALYNVDGDLYCTDDECSHDIASLSMGELEGCQIVCPRHGARFDVRTGRALCLPAVTPIYTYEVKVEGDAVLVAED